MCVCMATTAIPLLLGLATSGSYRSTHRLPPWRPAQHRIAPVVMSDDTLLELPLFDPQSDEIAFPFPQPSPTNALEEDESAPRTTYRYAFERPAHIRMLREGADEVAGGKSLFGHLIAGGDGEVANPLLLGAASLVRPGAIGVALELRSAEFATAPARAPLAFGGAEGGEVAIVGVSGSFRFVVEEVTRTLPYPVARVRRLLDTPVEADDERERTASLEARVTAALARLIEVSRRLEASGSAPEAAEAALAAPAAVLSAHEQAVLGGSYASLTERWECLSLAVCEVTALATYAAAAEALCTTSAARRFELLLTALEPAAQEMGALAALDRLGGERLGGDGASLGTGTGRGPEGVGGTTLSDLAAALGGGSGATSGSATGAAAGANARQSMLGGTTAFAPIDIPVGRGSDAGAGMGSAAFGPEELPDGTRIEYWYNEELKWIAATVRRRVRGRAGELLHTLDFDMDGTWEDCPLYFGQGKPRWRPLR